MIEAAGSLRTELAKPSPNRFTLKALLEAITSVTSSIPSIVGAAEAIRRAISFLSCETGGGDKTKHLPRIITRLLRPGHRKMGASAQIKRAKPKEMTHRVTIWIPASMYQRLHKGFVNLLRVNMFIWHESLCPPRSRPLCRSREARDVLPGVEPLPHLLSVCRGGKEMPSRAEVLHDGPIRGEKPLGVAR